MWDLPFKRVHAQVVIPQAGEPAELHRDVAVKPVVREVEPSEEGDLAWEGGISPA